MVDVRGIDVDRRLRLRQVTRVVHESYSIDRDAREFGIRRRTSDAFRLRELPEHSVHRGAPHRRERGMVLRGDPLIVGNHGRTGRVRGRIRVRRAKCETRGSDCQSDAHEYDKKRMRPFHRFPPPAGRGFDPGPRCRADFEPWSGRRLGAVRSPLLPPRRRRALPARSRAESAGLIWLPAPRSTRPSAEHAELPTPNRQRSSSSVAVDLRSSRSSSCREMSVRSDSGATQERRNAGGTAPG